jgi:hypothetical protein
MWAIAFPLGRHAAAELGSGIMLVSGLAIAATTETAPSIDPTNLVTVVVAFLSAGGIGGLVARAMIANWTKEREAERAREDADRIADRAQMDRAWSLMERHLEAERSRVDQLVSRQYITTQHVEHQTVKE